MGDSSKARVKINGRPGFLRADDTQFSWLQAEHENSDSKWENIPLKSIIVISPTDNENVPNEYNILHVVDNPDSNDSGKHMSIHPRALRISDYPTSSIRSYLPTKQSPWGGPEYSVGNIHIIISTGSGTGHARAFWEELIRPTLAENGFSAQNYNLHTTTSESSVTELVQSTILPQANKGVAQSVLLLSGDGGIVDIVNALLSKKPSETYRKPLITLLPAGTGNALANSAVVGNDNTMGLRTMFCGSPKELPLFRATFSSGARLVINEGREERELDGVIDGMPVAHGAVVCSWGLHATLVADSDTTEYRKFGAERFKMAGKEALFPSDGSPPHAYRGKVSILRPDKDDWEDIPREEHGYILATLMSNLEAGFTISPSSRPLDGKLWLINFGHISGEVAMDVMTKAYQGGKHVEDDKVGYDEIQGLKIQFDEEDGRWRRVCLDGKIIRVEKGGWVEVRSGVKGVVDLMSRDS